MNKNESNAKTFTVAFNGRIDLGKDNVTNTRELLKVLENGAMGLLKQMLKTRNISQWLTIIDYERSGREIIANYDFGCIAEPTHVSIANYIPDNLVNSTPSTEKGTLLLFCEAMDGSKGLSGAFVKRV